MGVYGKTAAGPDRAADEPISSVGAGAPKRRDIEIRVAHSLDEVFMAMAIRSAVFLAEQSCPYDEEFDGNDMTATHLIGFVNREPAATIRVRYFGTFAKMERMAVRREFRGLPVALKMAHWAIEFVRRKGFRRIVAHTQIGRERFWDVVFRRYGGYKQIDGWNEFTFSGHSFAPIQVALEPLPGAFAVETDPNILNRPEGDWDRPGILELGLGTLPAPSVKARA